MDKGRNKDGGWDKWEGGMELQRYRGGGKGIWEGNKYGRGDGTTLI